MAVDAAQSCKDPLWVQSWVESYGEETVRRRSEPTVGANEDKRLRLYTSWFCPFAQRLWVALEEKEVDYLYVEVNPYKVDPTLPGGYTKKQLPLQEKKNKYPEFVAASPQGLVPALYDPEQGDRVWESMHAVQYVDERYDRAPYFLPKENPLQRARVRIWSDFCTDKIQKSFYTLLMSQNDQQQEEAKISFLGYCRQLAQEMNPEGPYFLGKDLSMVDIALFPFWQRFLWVGEHYRGLVFPSGGTDPEFARLHRWWAAVSARPAFQATMVCKDRLLASYSQYARGEGTSDYAQRLTGSLRAPAAKRANSSLALAAISGLAIGALALWRTLARR